jgi:hypothetical protein
MKIRSSTWILLPAQAALLIFVLYWHPILSASQHKQKWDRIKSGMDVGQVERLLGRKADRISYESTLMWTHEWVEGKVHISANVCSCGKILGVRVIESD